MKPTFNQLGLMPSFITSHGNTSSPPRDREQHVKGADSLHFGCSHASGMARWTDMQHAVACTSIAGSREAKRTLPIEVALDIFTDVSALAP